MFSCRYGICTNGVECMSECETHIEPGPDDIEEPWFFSDNELDRAADEYFDQREIMMERTRP